MDQSLREKIKRKFERSINNLAKHVVKKVFFVVELEDVEQELYSKLFSFDVDDLLERKGLIIKSLHNRAIDIIRQYSVQDSHTENISVFDGENPLEEYMDTRNWSDPARLVEIMNINQEMEKRLQKLIEVLNEDEQFMLSKYLYHIYRDQHSPSDNFISREYYGQETMGHKFRRVKRSMLQKINIFFKDLKNFILE